MMKVSQKLQAESRKVYEDFVGDAQRADELKLCTRCQQMIPIFDGSGIHTCTVVHSKSKKLDKAVKDSAFYGSDHTGNVDTTTMDSIIYGLRDPRTDDYRYVGKSTNGIRRAKSHFHRSHNVMVGEWMEELRADNYLPEIDILEHCAYWTELEEKEKFWILKLLEEKHPLLNIDFKNSLYHKRDIIEELRADLERKKSDLKDKITKIDKAVETLNNTNFGELILMHRKRAKLSREKLAMLSGVGKTAIFDIEHGKTTCRMDILMKLLDTLNIKLGVLSPLLEAI